MMPTKTASDSSSYRGSSFLWHSPPHPLAVPSASSENKKIPTNMLAATKSSKNKRGSQTVGAMSGNLLRSRRRLSASYFVMYPSE